MADGWIRLPTYPRARTICPRGPTAQHRGPAPRAQDQGRAKTTGPPTVVGVLRLMNSTARWRRFASGAPVHPTGRGPSPAVSFPPPLNHGNNPVTADPPLGLQSSSSDHTCDWTINQPPPALSFLPSPALLCSLLCSAPCSSLHLQRLHPSTRQRPVFTAAARRIGLAGRRTSRSARPPSREAPV